MPEKTVTIKRRFQKPTVEEVDAYCCQRQNHVDATRFCNFYESKGWMVGKSKMVDWKAATDNLTRAINRCTPLLDELKRLPGGYNVREKTYTPQQTHLIYKYLGEP